MVDIRGWLDSIGCGQYVEVFQENAIEGDLLTELTDEDLRTIGISALGHRKRILKAISELDLAVQGADSSSPSPGKQPAPGGEAERRQLTVLFADLVGSTELSRTLDPEDLRKINRLYQDAAKSAVEQSGGYVARYMGDGVLAYFGYPQAHEDDAERALQAGLSLTEVVPSLSADVELAVRVGVATGAVVVGDIIGEGAAQESAVVGETPNLAARLQGRAAPNTVVISEATQALTSGLFELEALPAQALKGFAGEVSAFRVRSEARGRSRFAARSGSHLSPFVGREEELELLTRRWSRAREGEGQAVLAIGEPGIGKSRLLQQLQAAVGVEPQESIFLQCSPYHQASALYPTIAAFERVLGFSKVSGGEARLDALRHHLEQTQAVDHQVVGLLAHLLSIESPGHFPAVEAMDVTERREQTLRALVDYFQTLALRAPLLCSFEDVHWADPTTRELLGRLVGAMESTSVLLIATSRPGFEAGWGDLAHVQVMSLSRLGVKAANRLVTSASGVATLSADVVKAVLNRAEGNPLFIEELTRTVAHSSESITSGRAIPATLQDSLMARIDATGCGKLVAQYASVVGRIFEHAVIVKAWESDTALLSEGLDALEQAGLLAREGAGELTRYAFKHALIRDAAYDSLLREKRRRLHTRVAASLVSLDPDIQDRQPELLAHHYTVAEDYEAAIEHWFSAGDRANNRSADKEALANLGNALGLLRHIPESPARDRKELNIRVSMITPTFGAAGLGSEGMQENVSRAVSLSDRIGDTDEVFPVLFAHCVYHGHRGSYKEALSIARDIHSRARQQSDDVPKMIAHRALGFSLIGLGEFETARQELEKVIELHDDNRHVTLAMTYGNDVKSVSLGYLAWTAWFQGHARRAVSLARSAIQRAQHVKHATSLGIALMLQGVLAACMRDPLALRQCSEQLLALGDEHGLPQWLLLGGGLSDLADLVERPDNSGAIRLAEHIAARSEVGFLAFITVYHAELAARQVQLGRVDDALETLDAAASIAEQGGERLFEPELVRIRGLVEAKTNRPASASDLFLEAVRIAREQESLSLELRAVTTLARHWSALGRGSEAIQLLQPIYRAFSDGFDTWDLQQAKLLLEDLS